MPKTLVIGDIHACTDELEALLDKVGPASDDQIISIGDIVDRGPYPLRAVKFFSNTPHARSLMGNREHKHILASEGRMEYARSRLITREQLGDAYDEAIAYFRTMPTGIELDEAYLLHGYWEPGVSFDQQTKAIRLGHPEGDERLSNLGIWEAWWPHYDGDKPQLIGHREYPFLVYEGASAPIYALDTRCVYGGELTGVLLPDFTVFSVPSRMDYSEATNQRYAHLLQQQFTIEHSPQPEGTEDD